jgi:hypothetical protein
MDAIYGVTKETLAELMGKYSELKAKFGERQGEAEFHQFLASRGLDMNTWALAHNGWLDRFRSDPTGRSEAEFHMMLQQHAQRAHFADVRDMSADTIEGITLDQYAQITVAVSRQGADADQIVRQFGLQDVAHWQRANAAWTAKMGADTTHALTMQFGQLYQKYAGPQFQQEMLDQTAGILAEANKPQDVVSEPEEELTPDLCLRKMQSPSRNERFKYARLYGNMADLGNVPNKAQAIANVTPVLIDMIESHDEHTTSDAEGAVQQLWDLEVRNDDIPGSIARCLNRAREKLTSLQAAFAPIQDKAVPERVHLQSKIQSYQSLVETMQEYAAKDWRPAMQAPAGYPQQAYGPPPGYPQQPQSFAPPPHPPYGQPYSMPAPAPSGGFPKWILAPIILAIVGGGLFAARTLARKKAADDAHAVASASAKPSAATASAPSATTTAAATPAATTTPKPAAKATPKKK